MVADFQHGARQALVEALTTLVATTWGESWDAEEIVQLGRKLTQAAQAAGARGDTRSECVCRCVAAALFAAADEWSQACEAIDAASGAAQAGLREATTNAAD